MHGRGDRVPGVAQRALKGIPDVGIVVHDQQPSAARGRSRRDGRTSDLIAVIESTRAENSCKVPAGRPIFIGFHKPAAALAFMVLWLIRHGESTWNTLGLAQGHSDQARLTPRGEQQAWAVAARAPPPPDRRAVRQRLAPRPADRGPARDGARAARHLAMIGCASGASASWRAPTPRRSIPRSAGCARTAWSTPTPARPAASPCATSTAASRASPTTWRRGPPRAGRRGRGPRRHAPDAERLPAPHPGGAHEVGTARPTDASCARRRPEYVTPIRKEKPMNRPPSDHH